jgi:HTH-type transcriptional regulator/antitoxin HigA
MASAAYQLPQSYLKLIRMFPLRVIRTEPQYDEAIAVIQSLAIRGEADLDPGESDYLDALASLVETYEKAHHVIKPDGLRPHHRLKWLANQSGMSQAKLAKLLGVRQPLISLIFRGQRELTLSHVRKLSDYFHVSPRYFIKAG